MSAETPQAPNQEIQMELARARTVLAFDRTLLAWVRTSLTLIAFGFTLAKFLRTLIDKGVLKGLQFGTPRTLGLTMMLLGIVCLVGGCAEQWRLAKKLKTMPSWSVAAVLALVLAVISTLLMVNLITETSSSN